MQAHNPVFSLVNGFVDARHASCAVACFARGDRVYGPAAFGEMSFFPDAEPAHERALFDLASLTKVVGTTSAVLLLLDQGQIRLDDPLAHFWPQIPADKRAITIRQLLTHTSGMHAWLPLYEHASSRQDARHWILDQPLQHLPGREVVYSCKGFIILGLLVEWIVNQRLDAFLQTDLFGPLHMDETLYNPDESLHDRIPYTEWCPRRKQFLRGTVHDENAQAMGGVSGNAGLFSTAADLWKFARWILGEGYPLLSASTVRLLFRNHTPGFHEARSLGWLARGQTHSSGGDLLSARAIGHTGFTGTSLWLDPDTDSGFILLTNRVHPTRDNPAMTAFRPRFHNAAAAFLDSGA